jgi:hypothetical protein
MTVANQKFSIFTEISGIEDEDSVKSRPNHKFLIGGIVGRAIDLFSFPNQKSSI